MDSARSCSYFSGSKPLSLLEDWMDAGNIKKARQAAWTATDVATFVPDLRALAGTLRLLLVAAG
jgi:hypothetical protein